MRLVYFIRSFLIVLFLMLSVSASFGLSACGSTSYFHNCFGTRTYADGHKYVGDFKNSKITGQGTYTYPNGNKYVGGFKNSLSEGFGSFTFANGKKYVGEWKNNKLNGYAIKYYADGRIYQKGIFKDGVFVE